MSDLSVRQPTAMELIQSALSTGASVDTIERLARLQKDMMDYEKQTAFDNALNRCQKRMKQIVTDATNPQTKSRYATYAQLDSHLRPIYTEEGFSISFNDGESHISEHARIYAYLSLDGFTRTYQIDMPVDGKGAKGGDVMTKTHAMGAAQSYGKRYLLQNIFNIAVGEYDLDGNAPPRLPAKPETLCEELVAERKKLIDDAENLIDLSKFYKESYRLAAAVNDVEAIKVFTAAKDAKKKEWAKK